VGGGGYVLIHGERRTTPLLIYFSEEMYSSTFLTSPSLEISLRLKAKSLSLTKYHTMKTYLGMEIQLHAFLNLGTI
jgi:hypothetical protein